MPSTQRGLLDRLIGRISSPRSKSLTIGGTALEDFIRDGLVMDKQSLAFSVAAVYACVRVIAETTASLPLILYRRRADGGKDRADADPLYDLLRTKPNPFQTSMEFREQMLLSRLSKKSPEKPLPPPRSSSPLKPLAPLTITPFRLPRKLKKVH